MIITETRKPSTSTLTGESTEFRIATNAKAFRVLVDGIYADKIGSITRELMSNAFDAHVRSATTVPFEVRVPNPLNPTFSIRDFGCSMTHEFVMTSYSTLFESSKSESNDEVGAFGLGAKSFLAYTDACTIACWLDGEVRRYLIRLSDAGVPEVTLVHRAPSNEPQGVEVSFAVLHSDFADFRRAVERCCYGFDVLPKVLGDEVELRPADFSGEGWQFWRSSPLPSGHRVALRQGCAVYPCSVGAWDIPYECLMMIDTPIGTANVTASRESLALTNDQTRDIETRIKAAMGSLSECVRAEYGAITSPVQRARFAVDNKRLLGQGDFPTSVHLPWSITKWDAGMLAPYDVFPVNTLNSVVLLHDNGDKVLRRQLRLRALAKRCSVYVSPDLDLLKRTVQFLELDRSQLKPIDAIPDVKVSRVSKGASTSTPTKKIIEDGSVWVYANRGKCRAGALHWNRTDHVACGNGIHSEAAAWVGEMFAKVSADKPVVYLTDGEAKKALASGRISEDMRLDKVLARTVNTPEIEQKMFDGMLIDALGSSVAYGVQRSILFERATGRSTPERLSSNRMNLVSILCPEMRSRVTASVGPIVDNLRKRYPMLFALTPSAITEYIDFCDATMKAR